jgi:hypothetical protein
LLEEHEQSYDGGDGHQNQQDEVNAPQHVAAAGAAA